MNWRSKRKENFLKNIPATSLDSSGDDLTRRCKFNFSYLCHGDGYGQSFDDWTEGEIKSLFKKIKDYSRESLDYWKMQQIGSKKCRVLSIYGEFPKISSFKVPPNVPYQACWGRFRLDFAGRLVGFVVPDSLHDSCHAVTGMRYDKNTFYVVFLDKNHEFYITGDK